MFLTRKASASEEDVDLLRWSPECEGKGDHQGYCGRERQWKCGAKSCGSRAEEEGGGQLRAGKVQSGRAGWHRGCMKHPGSSAETGLHLRAAESCQGSGSEKSGQKPSHGELWSQNPSGIQGFHGRSLCSKLTEHIA